MSGAPGRGRASGAAVLAPLFLLAACTGSGGPLAGGPPTSATTPTATSAGGAPSRLDGEAFLLLAFDGARASEPGGGATFTLADPRPGYHSIEHVQLVDDGGGRVRFGIGLGAVAGYKVSELPPDRMYVDVAA